MKPAFELADVITRFKDSFVRKFEPDPTHVHILNTLESCRTSALGGHVDQCDECGHTHISYNSCRNRHCPKCGGIQRENWIMQRKEEYLPVKYFHLVFTLPDVLNRVFLRNKQVMYNLLFKASWQTLLAFSSDKKYLGAKPGMTAILHTWGSTLQFHPHLHCLVPGGGEADGKWVYAKGAMNDKPWLFPAEALSKVFRAKFFSLFDKQSIPLTYQERKKAFSQDWVVYAKHPLQGSQKVIEYMARYSHRVALTNNRLIQVGQSDVTFRYKDYKDQGKQKEMTLDGEEFLRRFCLHILPRGFVHIRHYGFLSSSSRPTLQALQRFFHVPVTPKKKEKKPWKQIYEERFGKDPSLCPICSKGKMQTIHVFNKPRAPPIRVQPNNRFNQN